MIGIKDIKKRVAKARSQIHERIVLERLRSGSVRKGIQRRSSAAIKRSGRVTAKAIQRSGRAVNQVASPKQRAVLRNRLPDRRAERYVFGNQGFADRFEKKRKKRKKRIKKVERPPYSMPEKKGGLLFG